MPTTEWLNKYESIKDKLTCKIDLDAYFTEKVIGNMGVDVLDIGTVHFPTGTIFACDPLVELEDTPPFIQTIPAGTYPVKICVVPSEKYGDRYACVKVEVSREKPVRYELGMTGKEDLDEELGEDTTTCSAIFWRKTPKPTLNIRGTTATGSTGRCRTRTAICPYATPAGVTVIIPSTSGMTQRVKSALCMCSSSTLKPATRSRRKEGSSDGLAKTGADSGLGKWCPDLRRRKAI